MTKLDAYTLGLIAKADETWEDGDIRNAKETLIRQGKNLQPEQIDVLLETTGHVLRLEYAEEIIRYACSPEANWDAPK